MLAHDTKSTIAVCRASLVPPKEAGWDMTYQPIENYGMIGDMHTVALVGTNGSIDQRAAF